VAALHAPHIRRRRHRDSQPGAARRYHAERIAADRGEMSTLGFPFTAAFLIAGIIILLAMLLF